MDKIMTVLNRWIRRYTKEKPNPVTVIPATFDDRDLLMRMVYDYLKETRGSSVHPDVLAPIRGQVDEMLESLGGIVLIAMFGGGPVGMVWGMAVEADVWDLKPVGNVWYLWVEPAMRSCGTVAMTLINGIVGVLTAQGIEKCRIVTEDPTLALRYEELLGFVQTATITVLEYGG